MNTRQKMLFYPLFGVGLAMVTCLGVVPVYLVVGRKAAFVMTLAISLFQLFPLLGLVVPSIRLTIRRKKAQAQGLTLCSSCEYPLDLREGTVACPECGCRRTLEEHQAAWRDWRLWRK